VAAKPCAWLPVAALATLRELAVAAMAAHRPLPLGLPKLLRTAMTARMVTVSWITGVVAHW
jgi:hypothetical protein